LDRRTKQCRLVLGDRAEELATATGQPVDALLVQLDDGAELFLVLEQQRHVDVDVLHRAIVPLELGHHATVNLQDSDRQPISCQLTD